MSTIAVTAYEEALAHHHPWFLQKGAKLGMALTCSRAKFFASIIEEQNKVTGRQYTKRMVYDDFVEIDKGVAHLADHLWSFFK